MYSRNNNETFLLHILYINCIMPVIVLHEFDFVIKNLNT